VSPPDSAELVPVGDSLNLLADPRISAQLLARHPDSGAAAIRVVPSRDPGIPDLLLYWARAGSPESLPPDARLLAALRGSRTQIVAFPSPEFPPGGAVLLYSQGWSQVLAVVPLGRAP
jgi:hypothetical protein